MRRKKTLSIEKKSLKKQSNKGLILSSRRSFLISGLTLATGGAIAAIFKLKIDPSFDEVDHSDVKNTFEQTPINPKIERDKRSCSDYFKALELFRSIYQQHLKQKMSAVYTKELDAVLIYAFNNQGKPTFQESLKKKMGNSGNGFFCGNLEQDVEMPSTGNKPAGFYSPDHHGLFISNNFDSSNVLHQLVAVHETLHSFDYQHIGLSPSLSLKSLQLELRAYGLMIEYINAYTNGVLKRAILAKQDIKIIISGLVKVFRIPTDYNEQSKSLLGILLTLSRLMPAYFENYKDGEFSEAFVRAVYKNEQLIGPNIGYFDVDSGEVKALNEQELKNVYDSHLREFKLK